jgi:hypothetical protein
MHRCITSCKNMFCLLTIVTRIFFVLIEEIFHLKDLSFDDDDLSSFTITYFSLSSMMMLVTSHVNEHLAVFINKTSTKRNYHLSTSITKTKVTQGSIITLTD